MAITSVEALELSQLLGSLLAAVVESQAQAARATVDFVENVGFEDTPDGERLRTVKLRYNKKDENGERAEFEVEVPLLALVNIPSLAVKEAKLSFSYDIVTASQAPTAQPSSGIVNPNLKLAAAKITGLIRRPPAAAPTSQERRTTAVDLDVTLEQQEMPIGIERLFDLAELGISERPAGADEG